MKHRSWINLMVVLGLLVSSFVLSSAAMRHARAETTTTILYVKPSANGDCSSWSQACALKTARNNASAGDQIWVRYGTYKLVGGSHPPRDYEFELKNGVAIYGGFNGDETSLEQRDWVANETIISGDIGIQGDDSDNRYHVVTASGTDSTAILDGFTITGGNADGTNPYSLGGGMYISEGSPTLRNLIISGNSAQTAAGIYNWCGSPTLTNVTFSGNSASLDAGGMYNYNESPPCPNSPNSPTLTNVTFDNNTAGDQGGGMFNRFSDLILTDVTFNDNSADYGGGMYNIQDSSPTLTDVTFSGNTATNFGGGMHNTENSSPVLTNVTFSNNYADWEGGGMFNDWSNPTLVNVSFIGNQADWGAGITNTNSNPKLINVVFRKNTAIYDGGGMHNYWGSSPTLINVTLEGNSANRGGGMDSWDSSSPTLTNTILWGNTAVTNGSQIYKPGGSGTPNVSYSLVEGGCPTGVTCDHLLSDDPQFVDAANGNLRLQLTSPAIDAGDNSAVPAGVVSDIDGFMRFVDIPMVVDTGLGEAPIVDMGACEAQMQAIYLPMAVK